MLLSENDSLHVGRPRAVALSSRDGSIYVADGFNDRIIKYSVSGKPLGTIGRKGSGPGEFKNLGPIAVDGDTLLLAVDVGSARLVAFDISNGSQEWELLLPGITRLIVVHADQVLLSTHDPKRGSMAAVLEPGNLSFRQVVPRPPEYENSAALAGIFNTTWILPGAKEHLVAFMGLNRLTLFDDEWRPRREVDIPRRLRRGASIEGLAKVESLPYPGNFSAISALFGINRLDNGNVVLVHFDQEIEDELITADMFVTVLDSTLTRACVDGVVPTSRHSQPVITFRGDTLAVVEQVVIDSAVQTMLHKYLLSTSGCTWQETTPTAEVGEGYQSL